MDDKEFNERFNKEFLGYTFQESIPKDKNCNFCCCNTDQIYDFEVSEEACRRCALLNMTQKEKCINFCEKLETHSIVWLQEALDNLVQLKKDNINFSKLEGCPQNFGLDVEELCEQSNDNNICDKCWENALQDK